MALTEWAILQCEGHFAGLVWATPCMAHDGPYRLPLGPTWPKSALLFIVPKHGILVLGHIYQRHYIKALHSWCCPIPLISVHQHGG